MSRKTEKTLVLIILISLILSFPSLLNSSNTTTYATQIDMEYEEGSAGATAEGPPKYGGTFIIAMGTPTHLNPMITGQVDIASVSALVYQTLGERGPDMKIHPRLAESWETSSDGLKVTFNLVRDATWHDGKPLTSADWKFSIDEIVIPYHPRAVGILRGLKDVEAPDPYTLIINLEAPIADYVDLITALYVFPKHLWEGQDIYTYEGNQEPVGSGPYMFKEWVKGSHITLVKNPNYWRKDKWGNSLPYLDQIILKSIPDPATRIIALEKGEVDFLHGYLVPLADTERLSGLPTIDISFKGGIAMAPCNYLFFNNIRYPWNITEVRYAVAHAIDKEYIFDYAGYGYGLIYHTYMPKQYYGPIGWFNPKYEENPYPYDVDLANEMLDEAGFSMGTDGIRRRPDGEKLTMDLNADFHWDFVDKAAKIIKEQLKEIGIEVKLSLLDTPAYLEKTYTNWDFDAYIQLYTAGPEPRLQVDRLWVSSQITHFPYSNSHNYNSSVRDDLFYKSGFITDPNTGEPVDRQEVYYEIQDIIVEDLPAIPLWEMANPFAYNNEFHNVIVTPTAFYDSKEFVWWEGGEEILEPDEPVEGIEPRMEAIEESLDTLSSDVSIQFSSLSSQIDSLESQLDALEDPAPASNTMSYIAIAIAVVSIIVAYYFGTQK